MKRVRLRSLITPDHVRYILYAPMAILLPVALTAIFMISLLSCVMPLVKILLTLRHVCVGHQEGARAKLLTMCNVTSILTLHQKHGDRSSIGRALDCGSSGCGFKPHRSPFSPPFDALSQEPGARPATDLAPRAAGQGNPSIQNWVLHPATSFAKAAPVQQRQLPLLR